MKKYINGRYEDLTEDEQNVVDESISKNAVIERKRPFTLTEVQEMLIRAQINTLSVDDATAYRMKDFYSAWEADVSYTAANNRGVGYKVTRGGKLWKLRQEHTSMTGWEPGAAGTESLWEEICEAHDGSKFDPIPYGGNMALESGKYYSQDGVTYLCNRDTGIAVYQTLAELVGVYVEVVA